MAGKKIKNNIVGSFIQIQETSGLPTGFPLHCFVVTDDIQEGDFWKEQMFHSSDKVVILPSKTDWQQIAVESGLFSSRGDAKRNNFVGDIKQGFHEITSGKGLWQRFIFAFKA